MSPLSPRKPLDPPPESEPVDPKPRPRPLLLDEGTLPRLRSLTSLYKATPDPDDSLYPLLREEVEVRPRVLRAVGEDPPYADLPPAPFTSLLGRLPSPTWHRSRQPVPSLCPPRSVSSGTPSSPFRPAGSSPLRRGL